MPFFEDSYKDDSVYTFGNMPNSSITEYLKLFKREWNVLDIGCGEGKNSLYLASLGFNNIDAFDISQNAVDKLNRISKQRNFNINSWTQDLCAFRYEKKYDLIMSFGTLHFTEKTNWREFIIESKNNTKPNGLHIFQIFTNKIPASPDIEPIAVGLSDENELRDMYQDWDILQFKSCAFEGKHTGAPKQYYTSNKIVAQYKI